MDNEFDQPKVLLEPNSKGEISIDGLAYRAHYLTQVSPQIIEGVASNEMATFGVVFVIGSHKILGHEFVSPPYKVTSVVDNGTEVTMYASDGLCNTKGITKEYIHDNASSSAHYIARDIILS